MDGRRMLHVKGCHHPYAELDAHADAGNDGALTPLHCAALGSSPSCAQLLLDAGADRDAVDGSGQTPSERAPEAAEALRRLLKPSAAARKLPGATQATLNGLPPEEQSPSQAFAVSSAHSQHPRYRQPILCKNMAAITPILRASPSRFQAWSYTVHCCQS